MPSLPAKAERRAGAFDITEQLKGMKFSITCGEWRKQSPSLRRELMELVNVLLHPGHSPTTSVLA